MDRWFFLAFFNATKKGGPPPKTKKTHTITVVVVFNGIVSPLATLSWCLDGWFGLVVSSHPVPAIRFLSLFLFLVDL